MPLKALPKDLPIHTFATAKSLETFFDANHLTSPGFYVKLAKKLSGIPSVTSEEAIEVALCFGWINGTGGTIDDTWWLSRYTQRRAKSMWSQKNVDTVERLFKQGRMRPAGIDAVEAAKSDGRWQRAYAGPATIQVPDDLAAALEASPTAKTFFEGLNKTDRFSVLWRVHTCSPKTRAKRIEGFVDMLTDGIRPKSVTGANRTPKIEKVEKKKVSKTAASGKSKTSKPTIITENAQRPIRRSGLRERR